MLFRDVFYMWDQLEEALTCYNDILERRIRGEESIISLQKENRELQNTLKKSLKEDINENLIFAPKHFINSNTSKV